MTNHFINFAPLTKNNYSMKIRVAKGLPAVELLAQQGYADIIDAERDYPAQPLRIAVLNLMPLKEDTEADILRMLSASPMDIDVEFVVPTHHTSRHTPLEHISKFYRKLNEIRQNEYDGMIVTGAPLDKVDYENVDYWDEICGLMNRSRTNVRSTLWICWGAFAVLYHRYGIDKHFVDKKISGVFLHKITAPHNMLMHGMTDGIEVPHSRFITVHPEDVHAEPQLEVLAESDEAGVYLIGERHSRDILIMGHPEYNADTLDFEYRRDLHKGINPHVPNNYYPGDNPDNKPANRWSGHARLLYANWIKYFVAPQA